MSTHTTRRRDRLRTLLRRERAQDGGAPLAGTGLLQAPAASGPRAPQAITFAGGWDTPAARNEAAAIFGAVPHGIATPGTLDAIRAEADREAEAVIANAREISRREAERAALEYDAAVRAEAEAIQRDREEVRRNRPYTDTDPTLIDPGAARWEPPVSGAESANRIARLTYPGPDGTRERWAAWSRQMSAYTGTRSTRDHPAGWPPVFRTAGPGRPVMAWDADRPPLLALPAGTGATA